MNHERYEALMSAALDGEATAEERRELELHLAVCPECADLWARLCAQSAALRTMDCQLPDGLKERIMSQLPARPPRRSPWKRWAAACACLIVAAGAVFTGGRIWQAKSAASGSCADSPPAVNSMQTSPSEDCWEGVAEDGTLKLGPQFDQLPAYAFSSAATFCYRVDTALPDSVRILDSTEGLDDLLSQLRLDDCSAPDSSEDTWAAQLAQLYDADYFSSGRLAAVIVREAAGTPQLLDLTPTEVKVSLARAPESERANWLILATVDDGFSAQDSPALTLVETDNS